MFSLLRKAAAEQATKSHHPASTAGGGCGPVEVFLAIQPMLTLPQRAREHRGFVWA
jgi:hypothetical protein